MSIYENVRAAWHKRALYNRTLRELRALPRDLAIEDLGISPADADRIAYDAVYGR